MNVVVADVEITAMIDSGACCNIVDENTWGRGWGGGVKEDIVYFFQSHR